MNYYQRYDDIPVYNFYAVLENGDIRNMLYNFNDEIDNEQLLVDVFHKIYEDRIDYLDDNGIKIQYQIKGRLNSMEMQLVRLSNDYGVLKNLAYGSKYWLLFAQEVVEEGITIKSENKSDYLHKLDKQIKGFKNKIKAFKIQNKEYLVDKDGTPIDLIKEKLLLKEVLPNQEINIKKTSLKEWDALHKLARERIKHKK